ncbi:MAG: hypothetical protein NTZ97_01945 [Candidatus Moranbacteria bacterium]|nr:hypothetical protein [Candidatus Moranbacteria bacterium]
MEPKQQNHKIAIYYSLCAIAFLIFLKFVSPNFLQGVLELVITFLPFIIILLLSLYGYRRYRKNPEFHLAIRKHVLTEIFYLLLVTLLFYVLYSPKSFRPYYYWLQGFAKVLGMDTFFFILSYLAIGVVSFILIFFFIRLYQKSKGIYPGSPQLLFKHCLETIFIILFILWSASIFAFPTAYAPVTDLTSDFLYTLSFGKFQTAHYDGTPSQLLSLSNLSHSLRDTLSNLKNDVANSHDEFTTNITDTKNELDSVIARTNKDLNLKLTKDLSDRLDLTGGTINGKLIVVKSFTVTDTSYLNDIVPSDDNSYDLGTASTGWNNVYATRLFGSSVLTVGDGSSSHSLSSSNDFLISGKLEVNGAVYLDSSLTLSQALDLNSQKIINLGTPTDTTDAVTLAYLTNYAIQKPGSPSDYSLLYYKNSAWTSLTAPTVDATYLKYTTAGGLTWGAVVTSGGDVTGPASATLNNIAVFDNVNGKVIADGGTTIAALQGLIDAKAPNVANYAQYYPGGTDVAVADGGTGQSSYTNGQLLIGNTTGNTLTKATLTEGTGISITNSTGSISIASTLGTSVDLASEITGTLLVANGGTNAGAFTQGSIVFAGASGTYTQNNANFFWDNTNYRMGIGTTAPAGILDIRGGTAASGAGTNINVYAQNAHTNGYGGDINLITGSSTNNGKLGSVIIGMGTTAPIATTGNTSLSLQSNTTYNFLEILNSGGAGKGASFGMGDNDLELWSYQGGNTEFWTDYGGDSQVMTLTNAGNLGIGTTNPTAKLSVAGGIRVGSTYAGIGSTAATNYSWFEDRVGIGTTTPGQMLDIGTSAAGGNVNIANGWLCVDTNGACTYGGGSATAGEIYAVNTTVEGADYAEYFYTKDTNLKPGEVVCVDTQNSNAVKRCANTGDNDVMGIISSNPSVVGNNSDNIAKDRDHYKIVGMLGQVQGKVTDENGAIKIGDSLTSSATPGYMRKAEAGESTVGVAMQNFDQNQGTIPVLISRRNKSLTVEKVEEAVTNRIAEMDVQDQVANLIAQAQKALTEEMNSSLNSLDLRLSAQEDIVALLQTQIDELKKLTSQDLNVAQIEANTTDIEYLKTLLGISGSNPNGDVTLLGNLKAEGVETGKLTICVIGEEDPTIGTAEISAGGKSKEIKTTAVGEKSKIFVSPESDPGSYLWTEKIKDSDGEYTGFYIKLNTEAENKVNVNWWIVQEK